MRTAALILGIIGGVIDLLAAGLALVVGGIGAAVSAGGAELVGTWTLHGRYRRWRAGDRETSDPAVLMLIAGIGGFISISLAYVVAGPLLLVGAFLAFLGGLRRVKARAPPS